MFKESRNIKTADDFNEAAIEILENFLEDFDEGNGLVRPLEEEDPFEAGEVAYMYTDKGSRLAHRMQDRLYKVGSRHFDPLYINVETHYLVEP